MSHYNSPKPELTTREQQAINEYYNNAHNEPENSLLRIAAAWGMRYSKGEFERMNEGRKGWQDEAIHSRKRIKELESEKEALILQYTAMMDERDHYAGLAKTNADAAIKVNWENGDLIARITELENRVK